MDECSWIGYVKIHTYTHTIKTLYAIIHIHSGSDKRAALTTTATKTKTTTTPPPLAVLRTKCQRKGIDLAYGMG